MSNVNALIINDRNDLYTRYGSIEKINQLSLHTIEYTPKTAFIQLEIDETDLDFKNITILNVYGLTGDSQTTTSIPEPLGFAKIYDTTDKKWILKLANIGYLQKKIQHIYINYSQ